MGPLYTHCPHCGFPVVVKELERMFSRRCRQCRAQFIPGEEPETNGHGLLSPARRLRAALRARLRQRRRVLK